MFGLVFFTSWILSLFITHVACFMMLSICTSCSPLRTPFRSVLFLDIYYCLSKSQSKFCIFRWFNPNRDFPPLSKSLPLYYLFFPLFFPFWLVIINCKCGLLEFLKFSVLLLDGPLMHSFIHFSFWRCKDKWHHIYSYGTHSLRVRQT